MKSKDAGRNVDDRIHHSERQAERLVLRSSTFAEDENGNEVFLSSGTQVWDISDAGPVHVVDYTGHFDGLEPVSGWNVSFRVHHPGITAYEEVVTMDAVKLLRCLEGQ